VPFASTVTNPVLTGKPVSDSDPAAVDREHDTVSECRLRRGQVDDGRGGFDRWEAPIRNGLRRMRDRGELHDDTDVGRLALGTLAALQGGLLLTQAKRDAGPLEAALDLAIDQISHHLT